MSILSVRLHNEHVHLRSDSAETAAFDDGQFIHKMINVKETFSCQKIS
jgi:uncharacterized protein YfkK (UPF0435 family)